jgi:hypothetical protein
MADHNPQLSMLSDADDLAKRVSRLEAHLLQLERNYGLLLEQLGNLNWLDTITKN